MQREYSTDKVVVLDRGYYTSCTINLYGATVTSWKIENKEQVFTSALAVYDDKRPIRGGITTIFPVHRTWSFGMSHGFSRNTLWSLDYPPRTEHNGDLVTQLSLTNSAYTESMWNFPFKMVMKVWLGDKSLRFKLTLYNTSEDFTIRCQILRHVYLRIPDVTKIELIGLKGLTYMDVDKNHEKFVDDDESLKVTGKLDRIYIDAPNQLLLKNTGPNTDLKITSSFVDCLICNPGQEDAKKWSDFSPTEYKKLILVEPAHISSKVVLKPLEKFEGFHSLEEVYQDAELDSGLDVNMYKGYCW